MSLMGREPLSGRAITGSSSASLDTGPLLPCFVECKYGKELLDKLMEDTERRRAPTKRIDTLPMTLEGSELCSLSSLSRNLTPVSDLSIPPTREPTPILFEWPGDSKAAPSIEVCSVRDLHPRGPRFQEERSSAAAQSAASGATPSGALKSDMMGNSMLNLGSCLEETSDSSQPLIGLSAPLFQPWKVDQMSARSRGLSQGLLSHDSAATLPSSMTLSAPLLKLGQAYKSAELKLFRPAQAAGLCIEDPPVPLAAHAAVGATLRPQGPLGKSVLSSLMHEPISFPSPDWPGVTEGASLPVPNMPGQPFTVAEGLSCEDTADVDGAGVSRGSVGHPASCGLPCKYARKRRGCKDGVDCLRCHMCHWKRSKARNFSCEHDNCF